MKDVPFYANRPDNLSCTLAVARSALEYLTGKVYTWSELEDLTGWEPTKAAWTVKLWTYLSKNGLDVQMIEPFDYVRYLREGNAYLNIYFQPEELEWQIKNSNLPEIQPLLPEFLQLVKQQVRSPQLQDIDTMLAEDYLVTVQLNSQILNDKLGYTAHMILVHSKEGDEYIAHDPGLPGIANRHIDGGLLLKAMGGKENRVEVTGIKKR